MPTLAEWEIVELVVHALLGRSNTLFDGTVRRKGTLFSPFYLTRFCMQLRVKAFSPGCLKKILEWFADLASVVSACRIFVENYFHVSDLPLVAEVSSQISKLLTALDEELIILDTTIYRAFRIVECAGARTPEGDAETSPRHFSLLSVHIKSRKWLSLFQSVAGIAETIVQSLEAMWRLPSSLSGSGNGDGLCTGFDAPTFTSQQGFSNGVSIVMKGVMDELEGSYRVACMMHIINGACYLDDGGESSGGGSSVDTDHRATCNISHCSPHCFMHTASITRNINIELKTYAPSLFSLFASQLKTALDRRFLMRTVENLWIQDSRKLPGAFFVAGKQDYLWNRKLDNNSVADPIVDRNHVVMAKEISKLAG
jgi:hypothetical protein